MCCNPLPQDNIKRQQEESRRRNAKLKEEAAAAADLYDAMRNDSASRVSKTQVHLPFWWR